MSIISAYDFALHRPSSIVLIDNGLELRRRNLFAFVVLGRHHRMDDAAGSLDGLDGAQVRSDYFRRL